MRRYIFAGSPENLNVAWKNVSIASHVELGWNVIRRWKSPRVAISPLLLTHTLFSRGLIVGPAQPCLLPIQQMLYPEVENQLSRQVYLN